MRNFTLIALLALGACVPTCSSSDELVVDSTETDSDSPADIPVDTEPPETDTDDTDETDADVIPAAVVVPEFDGPPVVEGQGNGI
jgi:hypothetical protein